VNALAEYWKGSRRIPTAFPLERRDPDRMAAIGWDAVRLLISWSRIEPRPGVVDERYLDRIDGVVRALARRGIYTIVGMHQDAWGPSLAARPGEACTPPAQPALGWDGAPAWATLSGAAARCVSGPREGSPAVVRAWAAFFADEKGPGGVGVQTRFVRTWWRIAKRFARSNAVAGFDLLNEPGALGAGQQAPLSRMYARALAAIRSGERSGGGRRHLVLYEPSVLFSATGSGAPPRFTRDRDVVYAPHLYTGGFTDGPITREAFRIARDEAKALGGVPVLSGEWGTDPKRAGRRGDGYFRAHQRLQDDFRFSATLWTWRESCGDPHKIGDLRASRIPEVGASGTSAAPTTGSGASATRSSPTSSAGTCARRRGGSSRRAGTAPGGPSRPPASRATETARWWLSIRPGMIS
jgi:endoglycosylceramidase